VHHAGTDGQTEAKLHCTTNGSYSTQESAAPPRVLACRNPTSSTTTSRFARYPPRSVSPESCTLMPSARACRESWGLLSLWKSNCAENCSSPASTYQPDSTAAAAGMASETSSKERTIFFFIRIPQTVQAPHTYHNKGFVVTFCHRLAAAHPGLAPAGLARSPWRQRQQWPRPAGPLDRSPQSNPASGVMPDLMALRVSASA